jgi:Mn2+/Fe2+ NRAMP family transporter
MGISAIAMLYWSAVINGSLAPVLLVFVMLISNDRKVMGDRKNSEWLNILGSSITHRISNPLTTESPQNPVTLPPGADPV